jgi:copper chaperone NosL
MNVRSLASGLGLLAGLAAVTLVGCGRGPDASTPQSVTAETVCTLDGMSLADYPGPKAQIHYAGSPPEFFCDTVEMFAMVLRAEQRRPMTAVYTQDMAKADWQKPIENWIDARRAFYVQGSRKMGSMGPTFASFANRGDAEAFAREHGGTVFAFDEVTPEMADLRGGAAHDEHM